MCIRDSRNGLSDPYIKLTMNEKTVRSKTMRKTLDPIYEQTFRFDGTLSSLTLKPLNVTVMDYDVTSFDDVIGMAQVDLMGLYYSGVAKDLTVNLDEGTVDLQVTWKTAGTGDDDAVADAPAPALSEEPPIDVAPDEATASASTADALKAEGNAAFAAGRWADAERKYGLALALAGDAAATADTAAPTPRATLLSNRAAARLARADACACLLYTSPSPRDRG